MLMYNHKTGQAGFTLVEVMFAVVVLAILATLAMPMLESILRNAEVRNATESILNGLQRARAEAVARNTNVAFTLATDSSWSVYVVNPASNIENRFANEGSINVTRTVLPAGSSTITFNNVGQPTANTDGSATLTQVDLTAPKSNRNLRVTIGISGSARMCDPNLPSSNSQGC